MKFEPEHAFWNRLGWNLVVTSILVAVLPTLVVLLFVMPNVRLETEKQVSNQLQSVSELKQQQVNTWLSEREANLNLLLADLDLKQHMIEVLVSSSPGISFTSNQQTINSYLHNAVLADPSFHEFFLYNTSGQVVAASESAEIGKVLTHRPYFAASFQGDFIQPPYYEVGVEGITMIMGIPLYTAEGEVVGVLAGRPDVSVLGQIMLQRSGLGMTGETYLVSAESQYMVTPSLYIDQGFPLTRAYFSDGINHALQGQDGSGVYANYRDVTVIGNYRWIPELRVALLTEIEQAEAMSSYSDARRYILVITLAGAGLALLIGLYMNMRIIRPIRQLTRVASRFAEGELDQRAAIPWIQELAILASTFNDMSTRLKGMITNLEQKVADLHQTQTSLRESEDRYMRVVNGVNDGIWDWNILTNEDYLSPRWKEILGYDDDELPNKDSSFFDLIHPDDKKRVNDALTRHFEENAPYHEEIRLCHKDGSYRWILTRGRVVRDESGQPVRMAGSITDITESKQAEQQISYQANLLQNVTDAIYATDLAFEITSWNKAAEKMYGWSAEEVIGRPVAVVIVAEYPDQTSVEIRSQLLEEGHWSGEGTHQRRDGSALHVLVSAQLLRDSTGEVIGAVGISHDITRQKMMDQTLRQNEKRLAEAQRIANLGYWEWDTASEELFWSEETKRIIGHQPDMGTPSLDLFMSVIHPDDREYVQTNIQNVLSQGIAPDMEYKIIRPDGSVRFTLARTEPILDASGQVKTLSGTLQDITERKQTEQALRESEAKLRALLNAMPDAMFGFDAEGTFIEYKPADNFPLMMPPEEFMGKNFRDILPPEVAELTAQSLERMRVEGTVQSFEYVIPMEDGPHDYEARVFALESERSFIVVRDITERKRAEKHIREQARLLDLIFHHTPNLLALLDKDFNFVRVSESYASAGERDVSYFTGRNHFEVYPSDFEAEARDVKQKKYIYHKDARPFIYADHPEWGVTYWDLGFVPILDDDGEVELFLLTLKDVTEPVRAEQEIRQLNEELEQRVVERTRELEEANKEIRNFAYIVSHDLRAPLVNLKGYSDELRSAIQIVKSGCDKFVEHLDPDVRDLMRQALTEDIPEALHYIDASVGNIDTFSSAILRLSRLGRLQLDLIDVSTKSVVEQTLNTLAYQLKGVEVTIGDLPVITADMISMEQIFGNILSNAVAYLNPERPGRIKISATQTLNETIFTVRDNGRGIAQDDMHKVFAPFRRAGRQDVPGEGMGLAYVQVLVRRHGGQIWCDSQVGVGTTFTFTISRKLASEEPEM